MALIELGQHPRGRVPGATIFKPAAATNIAVAPPVPSSASVYGFANSLVESAVKPPKDMRHCVSGANGLAGFFTTMGDVISENGRAEADRFHSRARPYGGAPRMALPSARAANGAKFGASSLGL